MVGVVGVVGVVCASHGMRGGVGVACHDVCSSFFFRVRRMGKIEA